MATYKGDLLITDGDITISGGDYTRTSDIDTMIAILVGTDSGYWGNAIRTTEEQIPGGLEKFDGIPITSTFLKNYESAVKVALQPLIDNGIAKKITVSASNPDSDRTDWTAKIVLADDSIYYYNKTDGGSR